MPTMEIHLLGGFHIKLEGESQGDLTGRQQALLACILLQPNQSASRQQIAVSLWPDSPDRQARTNLRRLLLLLRQALPQADDLLEISPNRLAWRPQIPASVDVLQFQERLGQDAENRMARCAILTDAVDLYRGELLPDCYEEWILPERGRLRNAYAQALSQLTLLAEGDRDYPEAIRYARRLLRHDPLHEASYRRLMRLLALTGDRAGALQTYHRCATLLNRELGVVPGPETQKLYTQLVQHEGAASPQTAKTGIGVSGRLVGRAVEWQTMQEQWRASRPGNAHWVLITGEAGMGKSRLVEEMLAWAERQGIPAGYARSYASTSTVSYGPLVDLMRGDALRPGWQELADHWLTDLSRLLPEIHTNHPHLPPPSPLTEEWQKGRLFEALALALTGDGRSHLLVLDDLQWADGESLEFLAFLMRYAAPARLLVVSAARSEEMPDNGVLQLAIREAASQGQLTMLPLKPLNPVETGELAFQTGGVQLDQNGIQRLHDDSGGNPLFVVEMVRAREAGWEPDAGGRPRIPELHPPILSLPPRIQATIESRLDRLSQTAWEIAAQAAVLGRSFAYSVLATVCPLEEAELVDGLDELWQRHIIREVGAGGYDFSHDRIRDVVYGMISQARRRLLHRQAGEALLHIHGQDLGAVHGRLGRHFASAGEDTAAIDHYRQAAAVALERYAHTEAADYLAAAMVVAENVGDAVVYPLLTERERIYRMARRMDEGAADLALLTPLVERMNDGSKAAIRRAARLTLCRHYYASWARDSDQAVALAQESLELAQRGEDRAIETEALLRYGQELTVQGRFDIAASVLADGHAKAVAAGLPIMAAMSLERQASIHIIKGGNELRLKELLLESLRLSRDMGTESRISDILNKLGYAILVRGNGEYAQALAYLEQGLEIGQRVGNRAAEMKILRALVALHTCQGEYGRAQEYLNLMQDRVTQLHDEPYRGTFQSWLAFWLLQQGRLCEAKAAQKTALAFMREKQQQWDIPRIVTIAGWIAFYAGHWQQAEAYAAEGVTKNRHFDGSRHFAHALTCRGWARLHLAQVENAIQDFQHSAEILLRLGMDNRAQEPLAGLVQATFQQGNVQEAHTRVLPVARHLLTHPLDRTVDTFLAIHTCHTFLQVAGDPLAHDVYVLGHSHLQHRASNIEAEHLDAFWSMSGHSAYRITSCPSMGQI